MRVIYHNWSATKQRPHPQSVAEISHHSVLSGNRIRQCDTLSGSRHKDTDQCLSVAISFCRHRSVPVPCENGSAEATVVDGGRNNITIIRERKPLPTPKFQTKVIRDSNTDCRINPDPDVCWISAKILRIHCLVGVSHFAKFHIGRRLYEKC